MANEALIEHCGDIEITAELGTVKHEIEHDGEIEVKINWLWCGLVAVIVSWMVLSSIWMTIKNRVDCALKIQPACEQIHAEYPKP